MSNDYYFGDHEDHPHHHITSEVAESAPNPSSSAPYDRAAA
jgi:hypothetical protein